MQVLNFSIPLFCIKSQEHKITQNQNFVATGITHSKLVPEK